MLPRYARPIFARPIVNVVDGSVVLYPLQIFYLCGHFCKNPCAAAALQVQRVLMQLAREDALEDAHIDLLWSLTEKVCARIGQGQESSTP